MAAPGGGVGEGRQEPEKKADESCRLGAAGWGNTQTDGRDGGDGGWKEQRLAGSAKQETWPSSRQMRISRTPVQDRNESGGWEWRSMYQKPGKEGGESTKEDMAVRLQDPCRQPRRMCYGTADLGRRPDI